MSRHFAIEECHESSPLPRARRPRIVERPSAGRAAAGWVRLAVSHVGICGTDYHIFEGKHPSSNIRASWATRSPARCREGRRRRARRRQAVIVNPYLSCGNASPAGRASRIAARKIKVLGVHRDGALCEEILVPAENLYAGQWPVAGGRGDRRIPGDRRACGTRVRCADPGAARPGHRRRADRSRHRAVFAHRRPSR